MESVAGQNHPKVSAQVGTVSAAARMKTALKCSAFIGRHVDIQLKLIDTKAAAEMLSLPEGTLKGWRCREVGPKWIKMGRDVRYDIADLLEFVKKNTRVPSVRAFVEDSVGAL